MKFKPYNKPNNKPKLHIIININFLSRKNLEILINLSKIFYSFFFSFLDCLNFSDKEKIKLILKASENEVKYEIFLFLNLILISFFVISIQNFKHNK